MGPIRLFRYPIVSPNRCRGESRWEGHTTLQCSAARQQCLFFRHRQSPVVPANLFRFPTGRPCRRRENRSTAHTRFLTMAARRQSRSCYRRRSLPGLGGLSTRPIESLYRIRANCWAEHTKHRFPVSIPRDLPSSPHHNSPGPGHRFRSPIG
jgi:hypothetical protein